MPEGVAPRRSARKRASGIRRRGVARRRRAVGEAEREARVVVVAAKGEDGGRIRVAIVEHEASVEPPASVRHLYERRRVRVLGPSVASPQKGLHHRARAEGRVEGLTDVAVLERGNAPVIELHRTHTSPSLHLIVCQDTLRPRLGVPATERPWLRLDYGSLQTLARVGGVRLIFGIQAPHVDLAECVPRRWSLQHEQRPSALHAVVHSCFRCDCVKRRAAIDVRARAAAPFAIDR